LPNFELVPKGRSHSRQKHLPNCFQNCTIKNQLLSKLLEESSSFSLTFIFLIKIDKKTEPNAT
jgi:hypothetical protein